MLVAWLVALHLTTALTRPNTEQGLHDTEDGHPESLIRLNSTITSLNSSSLVNLTLPSATVPLPPSPASPLATLGERCGTKADGPDSNIACAEGLRCTEYSIKSCFSAVE